MSKKILVIIGLAAVIAVTTGVIAISGDSHQRSADADPSSYLSDQTTDDGAVTEDSYTEDDTAYNADDQTEDTPADVTEAPAEDPTEDVEAETEPEEETVGDEPVNADDGADSSSTYLLADTSYSVARVFDHSIGQQSTPREVFGSLYGSCYLSFSSDGSFADPASYQGGELSYDKYSDGSGSEYTICSSDGQIDYIIVNYGDYDVYFS